MAKKVSAVFIFLIISSAVFAQQIRVQAENIPLADLLLRLRDKYEIQFAYESKTVEGCRISKKKSYPDAEAAIADITESCGLRYERKGAIFLILPDNRKSNLPKEPEYYSFSGKVLDPHSGESLPSAVIRYQNKFLLTDTEGNFSFKAPQPLIALNASYLGYFKKDTLIKAASDHIITLLPAQVELEKIVVNKKLSVSDMHIGQSAGMFKLNHGITGFLAGNQNNGIYNLLRLQAGIMAAGEQSNNYTLWGSHQGQSIVEYDKMRLFSIKSYNERQNAVNPLMIKEINVEKGAFGPEQSDCSGGIIRIIGKNGNPKKFTGKLNLNNEAASAYLNAPLTENSLMQAAYRESYELMNKSFISKKSKEGRLYLTPEYKFRDFNLKLSGQKQNGNNFFLSLLGSTDRFDYELVNKSPMREFSQSSYNKRKQYGASFFFDKKIASGILTDFSLAYSALDVNSEGFTDYLDKENPFENFMEELSAKSRIGEFEFKSNISLPAKGRNQFSAGVTYVSNHGKYEETFYERLEINDMQSGRPGFYFANTLSLFDDISLKAGIRADYSSAAEKLYWQPRLKASYRAGENWKLNFSGGLYNQFLLKNTVIDRMQNYRYIHTLAGDSGLPVLQSLHYAGGLTYNSPILKISLEAFNKKTNALSMFIFDALEKKYFRETGNSKAYGADAYIKTSFRGHEFWLAYSWSKTSEQFPFFTEDEYRLAPHHQDHEIKTALLLDFSPFHLSANYVYGSGLQFTSALTTDGRAIPYSRFDIAFLYRFNFEQIKVELGLSVLNVFNTENIKYTHIVNLPGAQKAAFARSTPFRPLLNLHISF